MPWGKEFMHTPPTRLVTRLNGTCLLIRLAALWRQRVNHFGPGEPGAVAVRAVKFSVRPQHGGGAPVTALGVQLSLWATDGKLVGLDLPVDPPHRLERADQRVNIGTNATTRDARANP